MIAIVKPSEIRGTVTAPASKSVMQRACAAALVKGGTTILQNPGSSADDLAALDIIKQLGANVKTEDDTLIIRSKGIHPVSGEIHCGESGLSARLFTSLAALSDEAITIKGSGSLVKRPLNFFDEILPQLNVSCKSNGGNLPLHIKGPLAAKNIRIDGSLSSQFLTGLLFAYAAANASDKTISVDNLNSKPYIDLTLQLMADFGLKTPLNNHYSDFYFDKQYTPSFPNEEMYYTIEGDWSGASFLLVAGAICGSVIVKGLDTFSMQADKKIMEALIDAGATIDSANDQIEIKKNELNAFHFNATDCPDLFPPLAVLASCCKGDSVIRGVHRLAHKESDRAQTVLEEFKKINVKVELQDDLMIISGGGVIKGTKVNSHHDHRIAMALAIAGLVAREEVTIDHAEAVNKSYPQFWKHLQQLHAGVSLINK